MLKQNDTCRFKIYRLASATESVWLSTLRKFTLLSSLSLVTSPGDESHMENLKMLPDDDIFSGMAFPRPFWKFMIAAIRCVSERYGCRPIPCPWKHDLIPRLAHMSTRSWSIDRNIFIRSHLENPTWPPSVAILNGIVVFSDYENIYMNTNISCICHLELRYW